MLTKLHPAKNNPMKTSNKTPFLFISPVLVFLILIVLIPFIWAFIYSLTSLSLTSSEPFSFRGLKNYHELMKHDQQFSYSLLKTAIFTGIVVSWELVFGMCLAVFVNREFKGKRWFTTLFTLPTMIAPVAVGLIWRFILIPTYGIGMYYLNLFGFFSSKTIFSGKFSAFAAIAIIDIWQWTPFIFLIMLAGLTSLPKEPFEAAAIDGASRRQIFFKVTLPLLKPMIFIAVLLRSIDAFKIFDKIFILTQGGPGNATELISMYTYRLNFLFWHLGYGAAAVVVVYLFVLAATAIFQKMTYRSQA